GRRARHRAATAAGGRRARRARRPGGAAILRVSLLRPMALRVLRAAVRHPVLLLLPAVPVLGTVRMGMGRAPVAVLRLPGRRPVALRRVAPARARADA